MKTKSAFTMIELLVVVGIIALMVAMTTSIMWFLIDDSKQTTIEAQLKRVNEAVAAYRDSFSRAPGYFDEYDMLSNPSWSGQDYTDLTMNENMVISMMGGLKQHVEASDVHDAMNSIVNNDDATLYDPTLVGKGPVEKDASGTLIQRDAFYHPKKWEVKTVTGTKGADNQVPEIVDINGIPLLYFRVRGEEVPLNRRIGVFLDDSVVDQTSEVHDRANDSLASVFMKLNNNYILGSELGATGKKFNQLDNSLFSMPLWQEVSGINENRSTRGPYNHLGYLMRRKSFGNEATMDIHIWSRLNGPMAARYGHANRSSDIDCEWLIVGAGADGIYYSMEQNIIDTHPLWKENRDGDTLAEARSKADIYVAGWRWKDPKGWKTPTYVNWGNPFNFNNRSHSKYEEPYPDGTRPLWKQMLHDPFDDRYVKGGKMPIKGAGLFSN